MGAFDYLASQLKLDFYMAQFEPELLEYFYNIPPWAIGCWAIAVWFAFAGSVGLLLRKWWSMWAFGISIVGMILSAVYSYILSNGSRDDGHGGIHLLSRHLGGRLRAVFLRQSHVREGCPHLSSGRYARSQ